MRLTFKSLTNLEIWLWSNVSTPMKNWRRCRQFTLKKFFLPKKTSRTEAQFYFYSVSHHPLCNISYLCIGIVYCFFGIQLATQNYINPAIDIIKKKGLLGAELMNVSLLAMSNSLAESFIIVNSIFFGVSDIGISTVVQQAAFYGLINQGTYLKQLNSCCRNVLPDRLRGHSNRLVDRL